MKRLAAILILLLAFCGIANSAYLTQHEVAGTPLLCNVTGLSGCNIVASSPYSHILGISLAEYGLAFYGLLFILAALELALYDALLRRTLQVVAVLGALASIYFVVLQIFVINALCVYCMFSAILALLIFFTATLIEPIRRDMFHHKAPPPMITPPPSSPPWLPMPPVR